MCVDAAFLSIWFLLTGWVDSRALTVCSRSLLVCFGTKRVSVKHGQHWAGCMSTANYAGAGDVYILGASASFRFGGDKCVWEVRLEVVKGCLQPENVAVVVRTPCLRFFTISLTLFLGHFVLPACVICPHIFSGFLTPVDKRHPHLSAAATQPFVGLILRRAEKHSECVSPSLCSYFSSSLNHTSSLIITFFCGRTFHQLFYFLFCLHKM